MYASPTWFFLLHCVLLTDFYSVKQTDNFLFLSKLVSLDSSRRDEMFIELPTSNIRPRSRGAKRKPESPYLETLRSAGAPVALVDGVYKHLAPLEPEQLLVAASAVKQTRRILFSQQERK